MGTKIRFLILTVVILVFSLSACNFPGRGSTATPPPTSEPESSEPQSPIAGLFEPTNCLVGSWTMADFMPFVNSLQDSMNTTTGATFSIENYQSSGLANITFNADNTAEFTAEEYVQTYTLVTEISGQRMEFENRMTINGYATADYLAEGDTITYSNQDNSTMVIMMETMGTETELDQSLFGEPETLQLYQYSCPDANTLALKVIAIENMDPDPFIMTRVR